MSFWIRGRYCKLGDGFVKELEHVKSFKCKPLKVTKGAVAITHNVYAFDLSDQMLVHFVQLGPYLADSCLRVLDHRIVFDPNQYYSLQIYVRTKFEECESCFSYPDNCPGFVNKIEYGIQVQVVVLKDQLPGNKTDLRQLVKNALTGDSKLTVGQKQIDCRVLINHRETRKMTFGELFDFIQAFTRGQHQEYLCPVLGAYKPLEEMPALTTKNWHDFMHFLTHLYTCWRKIEIKLEQAEYPGTFTQNRSVDDVESSLKAAKAQLKKMDRNNMFEVYFVLKKLWIAYVDYLTYSMDNREDIDEGADLPGTHTQFQPILRKLNTWTAVKKDKKWCDGESAAETGTKAPKQPSLLTWLFSTKQVHQTEPDKWTSTKLGKECSFDCSKATLIVPDKSKKVGQKMKQTRKLKNVEILSGKTANEPVLLFTLHVDGLFGFVNMSGAAGVFDPEGLEQLNTACPRHCTADIRTWICTACGGVVHVKTTEQLSFVCACGSKPYREDLLTCVNPQHEEQLLIDLFPDDVKRVTNQFKKHQSRYNHETNERIKTAVQQIIGEVSHLIEADGDTTHVINAYLESETGC